MAPPLSRATCLASPLAELGAYWLDIRCGCGAVVFYPCKLLAQKRGRQLRVAEAIERLRCRQCGAAAARVLVTDDPSAGTAGKTGWRVEIFP